MNPFNYISKSLSLVVFFIFVIWPVGFLQAQEGRDSSEMYYVEMENGNIYIGEVLSESRDDLQVKTDYLGIINIHKKYLAYLEPYDESRMVNGVYWVKNKIPARYALMPTGFLQEARRGYYENRYLLINHWNFAISDYLSLGTGIIPLSLLTDTSVPVWIAPKVKLSRKSKNFSLSAGAFFGRTFFSDFDEARLSLPFMIGTYEKKDISFSVGLGFGTVDGEWMGSPAFAFSGSMRVGKRSFIFLENIMVNTFNRDRFENHTVIFSLGGRVIRKRAVWDFGLFAPRIYDDEPFFVIPYLGIYLPFKYRKNDQD